MLNENLLFLTSQHSPIASLNKRFLDQGLLIEQVNDSFEAGRFFEIIKPHFVIIDYQYPGGIQTALFLRKIAANVRHDFKIIMINSLEDENYAAFCNAFDLIHVETTTDIDILFTQIQQVITSTVAPSASAPQLANNKCKILAVDEDKFILDMLKSNLEDQGYEVNIVTDVTKLNKAIKQFQPAVVILDILLTTPKGIILLKYLQNKYFRKNTEEIEFQVIATSALQILDEEYQSLLDRFSVPLITTPIQWEELINTVQSILSAPHQQG